MSKDVVIIAMLGYVAYQLLAVRKPATLTPGTQTHGAQGIAIGEPNGSSVGGGGGGDDIRSGGGDRLLDANDWMSYAYDPFSDPWFTQGESYRDKYPYGPGVIDASQYAN